MLDNYSNIYFVEHHIQCCSWCVYCIQCSYWSKRGLFVGFSGII